MSYIHNPLKIRINLVEPTHLDEKVDIQNTLF